jgi:hypothetical protein
VQRRKKSHPEVLEISGHPFTIEYYDEIPGTEAKTKDEEETVYGDCDITRRRIRISLKHNETDEQLERTLLHEILHAILGLSGQAERLEGENNEQEEGIVVALENALDLLYVRRKN